MGRGHTDGLDIHRSLGMDIFGGMLFRTSRLICFVTWVAQVAAGWWSPARATDCRTNPMGAVGDSLAVSFLIDPPDCHGQTASVTLIPLSGVPPFQFSSDGGISFGASADFNLLAGTYTFSIVDASGCRKDTMVQLLEPPPLLLTVGQDTFTVGAGEVINLLAQASGGTPPLALSWSPPNGLSCTDCANPSVVAGMVGSYTVTLTDANGCSRSLSVAIDVTADKEIFVPSAFSPDVDGINDLLQPYGSGIGVDRVDSFQVWDRWGNLIWEQADFSLNDPAIGWDGTRNGQKLDPGVYIYVLNIRFLDGSHALYKGECQLIR